MTESGHNQKRMPDREDIAAWTDVAADPERPLAARHKAFTSLVTEFQDMAFASAYALLGDYGAAEDAAQDAFVQAWQNLGQLRDRRTFPGWLRQIVTSQCHRRLRRKQLPTVPLENAVGLASDLADAPSEQALRHADAEQVQQALQALPERERQITVLFYIGDYSQAEIAAFTGLSPVGVRKRLAAARRRLHERMRMTMQEELQRVRPSQDAVFAGRVLAFTKVFASLVNEGTSLVRSLQRLTNEETDPAFRAAIEDINQEIQAGQCLSYAMAKHPSFFSETYTQAIREGEVKGVLEVVLERLANGTYAPNTIPSFSPNADRAVENACLLTHLAGHAQMEPEHFLLGLLMAGESKAVEFLRAAKAPLWKLRWELQRHLADLPKEQVYTGASPALQGMNQIAASEAEKDGTVVIGTQYLLLGIVEAESTFAAPLLRDAGVRAEAIRRRITG